MATAPVDATSLSDAELIKSVRAGNTASYGPLYERHVAAANNLARQLTRSPAEADDLVSDAFAKVLVTLRAGRGPDTAFRAYLLTALRHTAYDKTRRDRRVELTDDVGTVANTEAVSVAFSDTAVAGLERSLAAKAFARLPERWQAVLWHTEIEGQSPAEVGPLLGLTANGVSALAYRAREGLRQAYLQVHLAESSARRCRATVDRLGAWTRSGLSKRETAQVEAHLDECDRCRALAAELADVNGALRAAVAPLVLGVGAAGYLATIGAGTAKAATVAAAGAGGAAGAASSLPRQLLGVAASTAALAAVVAIALTAGHSSPGPTAAPPPAASAQSPAQPPPRPPATSAVPAPTTPAPTTPAPTTPAPPTSTPATTLVPAPPAPPPTTPAGTATLVPTVPATPINLVPGGPPVDLPITVRNTGDATSDPVTMTLTLPNGVTAELTGAKPAARSGASDALTAEPDPSTPVVHCTGGTGTISCATEVGLAPGQAVTCTFALTADVAATGGQVTGTVSAGTSAAIQLGTVEVQVRQIDAVEVTATVWHPEFWLPRIDVAVTNRSTHAGQVTLTLDAPNGGWLFTFAPCRQYVLRISCVFDLDQGESTSLSVWLLHWWGHRDTVRVTATLGSAHQVVDVPVGCDPGPVIPPTPTIPVSPPPSPPVVSPPAVSPPAVTATPPAVSTPGSPRPSGPTTSLPVTTTSRGPTPPTGSPGRPR